MEFVKYFSGLFALTTYKWLNISQYSDLVGGIPSPLKYMKVSWDDEPPNIWKVIKAMFQTTSQ